MKTNITLALDGALLRKTRALAAEKGTALARLREGLDLHWTPPVRAASFTDDDYCVSLSMRQPPPLP